MKNYAYRSWNYAYRIWDDPYFWRWYVSESGKVYKFVKAANGVVTFERVL